MTRHLDTVLLVVLLVVVGLRPLIGETYSSARDPMSAGLPELEGPTLTRTLAFDLVAFAAAACALMSGLLSARRSVGAKTSVANFPLPRWGARRGARSSDGNGDGQAGVAAARSCGLAWGAIVLAVAAVVSTVAAGEKRPAIIASLDWVAALVTACALVRLLDGPWKQGLALAVLIASGLVNVADCIDDHLSVAQTQQRYYEQREELWRHEGVPLDSPQVALFERRLVAAEASGFFAHSNIAGAYLLLGLFASLGLAAACGRQHGSGCVLAAALAIAFVLGIYLTRGTGVLIAGVLGVLMLGARSLCADWLARHRRRVLVAAWMGVIAGIVGVVSYGTSRGTLPHPSLAFRWEYWTASAPMFRDHGLTGVGAENFGHHYTAYKPIASPEEVKNPHDLFVHFATEYGALGVAAVVLMLTVGSWRATRPIVRDKRSVAAWLSAYDFRRLVLAGCVCGVAILAVRIPLLESDEPAYVFWMTGLGALVWMAGLGAAVGAIARMPAGAARSWLAAAGGIGLFAFLVQELINFALFVPASRMTFLALFAVVVAIREPVRGDPGVDTAGARSASAARGSVGLLALTAIGLSIAIWQLTLVAPAQRALRTARNVAERGPSAYVDVRRAYGAATAADPYDGVPPAEHAQWLLRVAGAAPALASEATADGLTAIAEAIARSPHAFSLRLRQAQLHVLRARVLQDRDELDFAIAAAREAVRLYPLYPHNHVALGDCLRATNECAAVATALASYQYALDLDDQRPDWEELRRLSTREREDIQSRIAEAEAFIAASCVQP